MNGWQENMELTGPLAASEDAAYAIPIRVDVREQIMSSLWNTYVFYDCAIF